MEGNRGRRALPVGELEPSRFTALGRRPPDHLDAIARNAWRRVLTATPAGAITTTDREVLEMYCDAYSQYRQAKTGLATMGLVLTTPNGTSQTSPLVAQARQWAMMVSRLASELGLTPTARLKLGAGGAAVERDNDDAWLNGPTK